MVPTNPPGRADHNVVSSAEGATTPESLRPPDRTGEATLESSAPIAVGSPKGKGPGVTTPPG